MTTQKEYYAAYKSVQKFAFYLTGTDCTLYGDHKPLTLLFTTGMSSHPIMTQGLIFSKNRTQKLFLATSFCQGHLPWLFQV